MLKKALGLKLSSTGTCYVKILYFLTQSLASLYFSHAL
jgi:hypothetical protein